MYFKNLIILLFLFCGSNSFGQTDSTWVTTWRKAMVCIGYIQKTKNSDGTLKSKFNAIGSGIVMYITGKNSQIISCIIIAKHVLESRKLRWFPETLQLRFYGSDTLPFDKYLGINIKLKDKGKNLWFSLPDSTVDVACIPMLNDNITMNKFDPISITPIPYNAIGNNDDIYDGSEIFVLGYPGIAPSEILVKSILRRGVISWMQPIEPLKNNFLIDCNIFPGNSGGSVFTLPIGISNNGMIKNGGFIKFAGIVTNIYNEVQSAIDSLGNNVVDRYNKTIYYKQRSALATVEPATKIRELLLYVQKIQFN